MKPVTITLHEHHVNAILMSLEVLQRLHLGQFRIALETAFKKKSLDLGWDKMTELEKPLKEAYFPEYPVNGGPSICGDTTKEAKVSFEIQKAIELCLALRDSGGLFKSGTRFDGNTLAPSNLPLPVIDEIKEDVTIPFIEEHQAEALEIHQRAEVKKGNGLKDYQRLWELAPKTRGDQNRIVIEDGIVVLKVHRPRGVLDRPPPLC